jgi:hypothetical protein
MDRRAFLTFMTATVIGVATSAAAQGRRGMGPKHDHAA